MERFHLPLNSKALWYLITHGLQSSRRKLVPLGSTGSFSSQVRKSGEAALGQTRFCASSACARVSSPPPHGVSPNPAPTWSEKFTALLWVAIRLCQTLVRDAAEIPGVGRQGGLSCTPYSDLQLRGTLGRKGQSLGGQDRQLSTVPGLDWRNGSATGQWEGKTTLEVPVEKARKALTTGASSLAALPLSTPLPSPPSCLAAPKEGVRALWQLKAFVLTLCQISAC